MAETSILTQGLLTREDIEEIHSIFVLLDSDGSGSLSVQKLQRMAVNITKDENISFEEAFRLHSMLDADKDGRVGWGEFLAFVCKWLHERGAVRFKLRTDLPSTLNERESLHKGLAQLFALDHLSYDISLLPSDSLENRAETWDYFGEGLVLPEAEKEAHYLKVSADFEREGLQRVADQIFHTDLSIILAGLQRLREFLSTLSVFQTPNERVKVGGYLLRLFEQLRNSIIIPRTLQCLGIHSASEIQWEALKILTLFAPGPRVPGLPETHILHPSTYLTKSMILSSGATTKIVELCENSCLEVRDQALLALGFLARHDHEARAYIVSLNCLAPALRILKRGIEAVVVEVSSLIRAAWLLSILCGATMPREHAKPLFIQSELVDIADTLAHLFALQEQENLLANCLTSLCFVLPAMQLDSSNKWVLDRVIQLINHENVTVTRAALQTLRHIIWLNASQCQLLTESGLYSRLCELLLSASDSLVKLDILSVLRYLIQRGYTWEMLNLSRLSNTLQHLIISDPDTRWEALRITKVILESNSRIALEDMVRAGMVRTLFSSLPHFREISPIIAQVYGVSCITYNFAYLHDCAVALDQFVLAGWPTGDTQLPNVFAQCFGQEEAAKLFEVVKVLVEEVRKGGHDLYQLNHGDVNLAGSLSSLLQHFAQVHVMFADSSSQLLVDYIGSVLTFFKANLRQSNYDFIVQHNVTVDAILNCVQAFNVKCMEELGYPNGDNRLLTRLKKEDMSYFSIKRLIAQTYNCDKKLAFVDSKGDKLVVDSQDLLQFAIFSCVQAAFEEYLRSLQVMNKPVPNPLVLNSVELKLLVSGSHYSYSQDIGRRTVDKDQLLKELSTVNRIPIGELETFYEAFKAQSRLRGADGRVNCQEFVEVLKLLSPDVAVLGALFNAVDIEQLGLVDIKNFATALGVLRHGTTDQRIWLAFLAYDSDHDRQISRNELGDLLRSQRLTDANLWRTVESTLNLFDYNRDGLLNFEEFKSAVMSNHLTLQAFWMHETLNRAPGFHDALQCVQCGSRFYPENAPAPGRPVRCARCEISTPQRYMF